MRNRYPNPFPGKPSPVTLSGLFLLDPSVMLKLEGTTLRSVFAEQGGESLYLRIQRTVKRKTVTPRLFREFGEFVEKFPASGLRDAMQSALHGDQSAMSRMDKLGHWEAFALGASHGANKPLTYRGQFILAIERACSVPTQLIQQSSYREAADALVDDPLMRLFLWPKAVSIIGRAHRPTDLAPLQASVTLEVTLSLLAAWDVAVRDGASPSRFMCLLPKVEGRSNATSLFFAWIKQQAEVRSIPQLRKHTRLVAIKGLDETTLKRWSTGSHYPRPALLKLLARALFDDADYKPLWARYWASRWLNLLGYLAERCQVRAARLAGTPKVDALAPWPTLPFGFATFEAWCQARYSVWLAYHQARQRGTDN